MTGLLALTLLLGSGGLSVDSSSPDAMCPPLELTREAVAARLGQVELEGPWLARYVVVHRESGDFVLLTLLDPRGEKRLERALPIQGGSCRTLSQVIALVLERYFAKPESADVAAGERPSEEASSTAAPAASETPPATPPSPSPSLEPRASEPVARDRGAEAPRAGSEPRAWTAEAALWATNGWLAPALHLGWHPFDGFELGAEAAFDVQDHDQRLQQGRFATRRMPLSLTLRRAQPLGSLLSGRLGIEALGLLERGETRGITAASSGYRLTPGVGARLGVDVFPRSLLAPFAEATGAVLARAATSQFLVDEREVGRLPGWVVGARFGLRALF